MTSFREVFYVVVSWPVHVRHPAARLGLKIDSAWDTLAEAKARVGQIIDGPAEGEYSAENPWGDSAAEAMTFSQLLSKGFQPETRKNWLPYSHPESWTPKGSKLQRGGLDGLRKQKEAASWGGGMLRGAQRSEAAALPGAGGKPLLYATTRGKKYAILIVQTPSDLERNTYTMRLYTNGRGSGSATGYALEDMRARLAQETSDENYTVLFDTVGFSDGLTSGPSVWANEELDGLEDDAAIDAAIAKFPATFGLRAFPGEVFKIDRRDSFVSGGEIQLYTHIQKDGRWVAFSRGTPFELKREIVRR